MKRRKRRQSVVWRAFIRGFVATGLLDRAEAGSSRLPRDSLRRALKGGLAIASGTLVSEKLSQREYTRSAAALVAGSMCVALADRFLTRSKSDHEDGQNGEENEEVQNGEGSEDGQPI